MVGIPTAPHKSPPGHLADRLALIDGALPGGIAEADERLLVEVIAAAVEPVHVRLDLVERRVEALETAVPL